MRLSRRLSTAAASAFLLVLAGPAAAALVLPGQTAVAVFEANPSAGATLVATQTQPFATSNYTGNLISKVYSNDTTNALGGLTFTYQLVNDVGSANSLERLTVNGFTGYATDISYQFGTGAVAPTYNDRDNSGGVVGFTFLGVPFGNGVLGNGLSSDVLAVQTNSSSYATRIANVANGSVSPVNAFGPAGALSPEPTTLAAMALSATFLRRRRR